MTDSGRTTGYNLIKVNIYYEHLNEMIIAESAEYGVGHKYKNHPMFFIACNLNLRLHKLVDNIFDIAYIHFRHLTYARPLEVRYLFGLEFHWPCSLKLLSSSLIY